MPDFSWPLLLLCPTCEGAQAWVRRPSRAHAPFQSYTTLTVATPTLPTDAGTFTIRPPRSFEYLRSGEVRAGDVATDAASATIELFRLNGHDEDDPRPGLRAETWRTIEELVPNMPYGAGVDAPAWLPRLMAATGFLSVWISGLLT